MLLRLLSPRVTFRSKHVVMNGFKALSQHSVLASRCRSMASLSSLGLESLGLTSSSLTVHRNLSYPDIASHEKSNGEVTFMTDTNTAAVDTGKFTGRSPKDKFIVKQSPSDANIWWGDVNQPMEAATFDVLYDKVIDHYNTSAEKMYVFDGYAGANLKSRKNVRVLTELAWQHHFVTNMFLRPSTEDLDSQGPFTPDFTIINACKVTDMDWKAHGLNSEVFVAFNIEKKVAIIGGTWYGGEMKKGIFSMMNYWLPLEKIMAMHCSANMANDPIKKDTALFFGLSGTGKTTLSADPERLLIGDDEHGWDSEGIFNFEGGCYAKTINLTPESEPEIFAAIKRDALLENVALNTTGGPDYRNVSKTENARVSYPIYHIDNFEPSSSGGHPTAIVFLTADAYGVLPPVSKLSSGQAMYHFLSGYTAKVAGTERGVTEPSATFSACFGAAFLPLHPTIYADLLQKKLTDHDVPVYLVNTGWTGGAYGVGARMSLAHTRTCIDAILTGELTEVDTVTDPVFQLEVPVAVRDVPASVLTPRDAWMDKEAYDATAKTLAKMFQTNFKKYVSAEFTDYSSFGPMV